MADTVSTEPTTFRMAHAQPERLGCLCPGCTEVFVHRYTCQCGENAWLCAGCAAHLQATEVKRDDAGVLYRKPICAHHPTQLERLVCALACINSVVEKQTRPALLVPYQFPLAADLLHTVDAAAKSALLHAVRTHGSEIAKALREYREQDHAECRRVGDRNTFEQQKQANRARR